MADKSIYKEQAYQHVVKKNNEYIKLHYKSVVIKTTPDQKAAWRRQCEADGIKQLSVWIVKTCLSAKLVGPRQPIVLGEKYAQIPVNLKPDVFDKIAQKASESRLPLTTYIRQACDKKAGFRLTEID